MRAFPLVLTGGNILAKSS